VKGTRTLLIGMCRASMKQQIVYKCETFLSGSSLWGRCTCPVGIMMCSHSVALLIQVSSQKSKKKKITTPEKALKFLATAKNSMRVNKELEKGIFSSFPNVSKYFETKKN